MYPLYIHRKSFYSPSPQTRPIHPRWDLPQVFYVQWRPFWTNQQYQWKVENTQSDKPVCLNFRLNYLGEIKWRDWATTILFDRVWALGDPCVSDLLYEAQQLMRVAVQHEAWFLSHLYKFHQHASSGSRFTVQNSWLSYQTYSHNRMTLPLLLWS